MGHKLKLIKTDYINIKKFLNKMYLYDKLGYV